MFVRNGWIRAACAAVLFGIAAAPSRAATINVASLASEGWYSDDTRSDGTDGYGAGLSLIGLTTTDLTTGAVSPTVGVAGHDAAIAQHISFSATAPGFVPIGTHAGAVRLAIGNHASGKAQISHIENDLVGHGPGTVFADPALAIEYSWMGTSSTPNFTAALKIGIKTSEFNTVANSSRVGENVWDKLLVYEPGANGHTSNGLWHTETISLTDGIWWLFDRKLGFSANYLTAGKLTLDDMADATNIYHTGASGRTLAQSFALALNPQSVITSIQFGIGSGNANTEVFINQLRASFYESNNLTTFGPAPEVPEPATWLLLGLGLAGGAARYRLRRHSRHTSRGKIQPSRA